MAEFVLWTRSLYNSLTSAYGEKRNHRTFVRNGRNGAHSAPRMMQHPDNSGSMIPLWEWGCMRKVSAALACIVLLGCASASSTMLSEDVAVISAEGNGSGDREAVVQNALTEAARLTRAHGYRYFVVLTADNSTRTTTLKDPGVTFFNPSPSNRRSIGPLYGFVQDTYMAPDRTAERIWPRLDIMIRMYREGEIDPSMDGVWAAAE